MTFDPELLKQLIASFRQELNEHTQVITDGLLALEKNNLSDEKYNQTVESIFRSAHNTKGTARSLGINDVAEIAHRIESLFSSIQKKTTTITPPLIDLCLEAVDKMHIALDSFINKKPLPFDLKIFINNLESGKTEKDIKQTKISTPKPEEASHPSAEHDSIRVPILKIDKVSSLLEEIQLNKISMDDHYSALTHLAAKVNEFSRFWKQLSDSIRSQQLFHSANDCLLEINKTTQSMHKNMRSRINELSNLSHSLQEEVRALRMIPVGNLLHTLPRYLRDLSHDLNKQVELSIKGEEIKIDKAVLEGLKDPIIHILRNAIDHGIESPDERKLKGKPEIGHISIEIKEEASQIQICIKDDGAGIDVTKIASLVENKKILTKQELQQLNENEIIEFIFNSGFSTKDIITDVSGRGVGLNVVKSNIEDLNGQVGLSTDLGKGTTITLTVPLSILSERGLLVKCSHQYFVMPSTSVERVLLSDTKEIITIQGGQAIIINERTIPVRLLSEILQLQKTSLISEQHIPIVILKKGKNRIAFIVDEIIGEKEIVLKPFHEPLSKVDFVAGGTLLENNQVVIVLELSDLINFALSHNEKNKISVKEKTTKSKERPHILIADDSITTRTLEKSVLESKNYQVTVAVNGKEAWDILQKQKFSLLITDVMMPIMDGFSLTDRVKKSENLKDLPVIIVTSLGSDTEKRRGIEVGADAYIVKNEFESGALLDIVSQLI